MDVIFADGHLSGNLTVSKSMEVNLKSLRKKGGSRMVLFR